MVVHRGSSCVTIGSETSGSIRNVLVSGVVCQGTQGGIHIKSERGRGGTVGDIRIENMTMEDVGRAINVSQYFRCKARGRPRGTGFARTPCFAHLHRPLDHQPRARRRAVQLEPGQHQQRHRNRPASAVTINIEGLPEMPIEGCGSAT